MLTRTTGSRGGKRSVTHLSKAQLARKRANDREAQRNIRQRTKEHIENLEKKVKELEERGRSSSMERVLKRNKELEAEIKELRLQIASQQASVIPSQIPPELAGELLTQPKVNSDWIPEQAGAWPGAVPSHIPALNPHPGSPAANSMPPSTYMNDTQIYSTTPAPIGYEHDEIPQPLYTPNAIPIWDDEALYGQQAQHSLSKPNPTWTPFHPAFNQPSRFADLQPSGFTDLVNNPSFTNTTCWQSQPSVYAWQISTKLKAPVTHIDQLMFSVIHSQRHLAMTSDLTGEDILGPDFPSVHILFNQPVPAKPPSTLTELMARYSAVLSTRGFAMIPEKLASFMCMYRFVQWQIQPTFETFKALHKWQAPRPCQLAIPHPAWMDLPPWGTFRDKIIQNQERYENIEFQHDYVSNLNVNFPYDPMKALIFENGQIMVSKLLERHISDIGNMSMKKPFADKYPEFRNVCPFDEV